MKRALIATMIAGALALSMTVPATVFGIESGQIPVPVPLPDAVDSTPCAATEGSVAVARSGCCQRNGGICGCRAGKARCCDGAAGVGCSCQGDSTPSEEL